MKNLLAGKTCMITGATSGIGKALSLALAGYGARLVLVSRGRERGERTVSEVMEKTGNRQIDLVLIDLSLQESIRTGAEEMKRRYSSLDILINNAGVLFFRKILTREGIETVFATNYLGPFLLTNLMLELLEKAAPSRIINVVSEGVTKGPLDIEVLQGKKKYNPLAVYSHSKQAEILFTYELARRLRGTGVTSNCFYPGLIKTGLGKAERGFRRFTYAVLSTVLTPLFTPVTEGIKPGLFLAVSEKAETMNGKMLKRKKDKIIAKSGFDRDAAEALWNLSADLTNTGRIQSVY